MLTGYSDVQLIGEGGLGKVYRARKDSTGGLVAIKELRDVEEASPAWHRARRELEALLRLKGHAHVIGIEEVAEGPNGPCLVMEYAPNGSLMDRLNAGSLSGPELVMVGQQVCDALSAAHALGIVHRDIKPHNLLIDSFGQVKVCDFGIAQLARDGEANTKTSAITMAYASPEELDGDGPIGPPADVYSFGATMLHLITGKRPSFKNRFDTGTIDLAGADPALSPVLGVLRQSMAHEPDDRPTIDDLALGFDEAALRLGQRRARFLVALKAPGRALPPPVLNQRIEPECGVAGGATVVRPTATPTIAEASGGDARTFDVSYGTSHRRVAVGPPPIFRKRRRQSWFAAAALALLALVGVGFTMNSGGGDSEAGAAKTSVLGTPLTTTAGSTTSVDSVASTVSVTTNGTSVASTVPSTINVQSQTIPPSRPSISGWAVAGPGQVKLSVHGPTSWGNQPSGLRRLEYSLNGNLGGWLPFPADGLISGLTDCHAYSIGVRATNQSFSSSNNPVVTAKPHSGPNDPGASGAQSGQNIIWNWAAVAIGDCGAAVSAKVDGATISTAPSGPVSLPYAYSTTHTLTVTITDVTGATRQGLFPVTMGPPPPPTVSISRGGFDAGCGVAGCKWVSITSSGWSPGQSLSIKCYSSYGPWGPVTRSADGSGNYAASDICEFGSGVYNVYVVISGVTSNTIGTWRDW